MGIKGFENLGGKSKVAVHKVISDSSAGGTAMVGNFGKNSTKVNVPFKSNTKGATGPAR